MSTTITPTNSSSTSSAGGANSPTLPWEPPSPRPSPPPASQIDATSLKFHRYHPMPPVADAIQLVRIRPADPKRNGVPVCFLENHFLDLHPPYCALSYTWDLPEDVEELFGDDERLANSKAEHGTANMFGVVLDGELFGVRKNLFNFICTMAVQLAKPDFVGYDLFWIDAMCINQHDYQERNEQVSMMYEIYREADRVLCWLGLDSRDEMPDVADTLKKVLSMGSAVCKESVRIDIAPEDAWQDRLDQEKYLKDFGLPDLDDSKWWRFSMFFRRSWFFRLWVLQEVSIAKQIVMLCGDTEFEIRELDDCGFVLRWGLDLQLGDRHARTHDGMFFRPIARNVHRVCEVLRWCQLNEDPCHKPHQAWLKAALNGTTDLSNGGAVWNLLIVTCEASKFAEPVDNVFALVGIARHLAPHAELPMAIDYYKSETEVRSSIAAYIMEQTGWLNILSRVQHNDNKIMLPTWAPQFREYIGHQIHTHARFNASLSLDGDEKAPDLPSFGIVKQTELLTVGVRVGRISQIVHSPGGMVTQLSDEILRIVSSSDRMYMPTRESIATAVWKVLVVWPEQGDEAGRTERLTPKFHSQWLYNYTASIFAKATERSGPDEVTDLKQKLHEVLDDEHPKVRLVSDRGLEGFPTPDEIVHEVLNWGFNNESQDDERWEDPGYRPNMLWKEIEEYRFLSGKHAAGRRFFQTGNGYLGLGPEILEEDDEVWLLPRTTVPLVLRRVYVHSDDEEEKRESDHDGEKEGGELRHTYTELPEYIVLGECYVHGIMHGELITKMRADAAADGKDMEWQQVVIV